LFTDVMSGLLVLEKSKDEQELRNIEMIIVLRILNNLGYIGGGEDMQKLVRSPLEAGLVYEISEQRSKVLSLINKTLKETHL
ncbi:MAG: hypothetical protein KBD17_01720, partial [Candidatus Pacebacteria bacterium]|nr:hypothetical protein [Candidatus Paceibacterota bacterium]